MTSQVKGCTRDIERSISNWRTIRRMIIAIKSDDLKKAKKAVEEYENYNGVVN